MKLLFFSLIIFVSCKNRASFDSYESTIHSFVDDVILIEGMDIKIDGDYLARIGSKSADIRVINETALEVTVPDNAENGMLRIIEGNKESNIAEIQINRLFLVNNTSTEIAEHSIGAGRFIKSIRKFDDYKIMDMVFSSKSNEILVLLRNNTQNDDYQLYKYNILDDIESLHSIDQYYQFTLDDQGLLYGYSSGIISQLSLVDGAKMAEFEYENEGNGAYEFIFLQNKNAFRIYYFEVFDGLEYHYYSDIDKDTKEITGGDQEFEYIQVSEGNNDNLYAFIGYMGIVESSYSGTINDYILPNPGYASYFEYLNNRDLLIATMIIEQADGTNPSFIVTKNTSNNIVNQYQIGSYKKVLLAITN